MTADLAAIDDLLTEERGRRVGKQDPLVPAELREGQTTPGYLHIPEGLVARCPKRTLLG